jgi:hypothetical protein
MLGALGECLARLVVQPTLYTRQRLAAMYEAHVSHALVGLLRRVRRSGYHAPKVVRCVGTRERCYRRVIRSPTHVEAHARSWTTMAVHGSM